MNNRETIETYYRAHRDELVAFVSARLHYSDDAEDLVQDAFLRLLTGNRLISEVTLPNLLYTLCSHLVIDWYRRRNIMHKLETSNFTLGRRTLATSGTQELQTSPAEAESLLSVREINEQLERGLARVPENCRELYRMHIYGGMQARDLCQQTGESYKSVEYRLGLARKQVRQYLRHIS
jgi:RNA polymerase sigma-70 factor (ECF subfamily)